MRGAAAALLLLPWLLRLCAQAATSSCAPSCGGLTVPYPFGFSAGCKISLGYCDPADGTAWVGGQGRELGLRLRNVTERALVVELRPDCSRRLGDALQALFSSGTFAPSAWNALVVSSCNATAPAATNCSIPPGNYLDSSSRCAGPDADSIRCVPPPSPPHSFARRFLNRTGMMELGKECRGLVSAVSYSPSPAPALLLGALDLEWSVPLLTPRELHGGRHADGAAGVPLRLPRGRRRRLPERSVSTTRLLPLATRELIRSVEFCGLLGS
jgi:hypothetical protein